MITYSHTQLLQAINTLDQKDLAAEIRQVFRDQQDVNGMEPVAALHLAARLNKVSAIEPILELGGRLDMRDKRGWTPTMAAVAAGSEEFVREMERHGADLRSEKAPDGSTLLHLAAYFERTSIAQFLIEKGLDVNAQNVFDRTPAHESSGNVVMLELLHANGAALDVPDSADETVGHAMARDGRLEALGYLASRGVDFERANAVGESVAEIAIANAPDSRRLIQAWREWHAAHEIIGQSQPVMAAMPI